MKFSELNVKQQIKVKAIIIKFYGKLDPSQIRAKVGMNVGEYKGCIKTLSTRKYIVAINKNNYIPKNRKHSKKNQSSFKNSDGIYKQIARNIIKRAILKSGLYGKILSLPDYTCKLELQLINEVSKKFSFVGCEHDPNIYYKMLDTISRHRLKMDTSSESIGEKIEVARENEYDHLILDYCGQLNSFHTDIQTAIENNIVKVGGTISITLNKRQTVKGGIEDEMNELNPIGDIKHKHVENAILTFIRIVGGFNYSIETVNPYKDAKRGAMILVVVKRKS